MVPDICFKVIWTITHAKEAVLIFIYFEAIPKHNTSLNKNAQQEEYLLYGPYKVSLDGYYDKVRGGPWQTPWQVRVTEVGDKHVSQIEVRSFIRNGKEGGRKEKKR